MIRSGLKSLPIPLLLLALAGLPAFAQEEPLPEIPDAAEDPCRALPEDAVPEEEETEDARKAREEELAVLLDRCNGVLTPPDIGEREMVEPPPDVGRTPVIRPEDLPGQQPGREGSDADG